MRNCYDPRNHRGLSSDCVGRASAQICSYQPASSNLWNPEVSANPNTPLVVWFTNSAITRRSADDIIFLSKFALREARDGIEADYMRYACVIKCAQEMPSIPQQCTITGQINVAILTGCRLQHRSFHVQSPADNHGQQSLGQVAFVSMTYTRLGRIYHNHRPLSAAHLFRTSCRTHQHPRFSPISSPPLSMWRMIGQAFSTFAL